MIVKNYGWSLLVLVAMTLSTQATDAAEKHRIVLDRDSAVGDVYRINLEASGSEASGTSLDGQKIDSEAKILSASMTAAVEVLSLHDDGGVQSVALKIESFEGEHSGKAVELDKAKRLIVTAKTDDNTYAYEAGVDIKDANTIELLNMITDYIVNDADDGDSPEDEALFNLQDPKAVGESWACNNKLMAADLAKEGLVVDPEQMESEMTFVAVESHHDTKCAKLAVAVEFGSLDIPELREQGFTIDQSDMTLAVNGLLPLDTEIRGGIFELEMAMTMSANAEIDQGKIRIDIESGHKLKLTYLPMEN